MQIKQPAWQIKKTCPCCGQGYPIFVVCPNCNYLTLDCDETGSTFINPRNLELGFTDSCPNCEKIKTEDFVLATADQINRARFTKEEYE